LVSEPAKYNKPTGDSIKYSSSGVSMSNWRCQGQSAEKTGCLISINYSAQNNWCALFSNQKSGLSYWQYGDSLTLFHDVVETTVPAGSGFAIRRRPRLGSGLNGPLKNKNSGLLASKESK
jgi:hypothetical protein